jgi:hypothetical protein
VDPAEIDPAEWEDYYGGYEDDWYYDDDYYG